MKELTALKDRIERIRVADSMDLLYFIRLASRMKGLGDPSQFERIPQLLRPFIGGWEETLKKRLCQLFFELSETPEDELAVILIEAQDLWLFYRYGRSAGLVPEGLFSEFEKIPEKVESTAHEEAVRDLDDWVQRNPVEYRLSVFH